jgi:hypothetical protein
VRAAARTCPWLRQRALELTRELLCLALLSQTEGARHQAAASRRALVDLLAREGPDAQLSRRVSLGHPRLRVPREAGVSPEVFFSPRARQAPTARRQRRRAASHSSFKRQPPDLTSSFSKCSFHELSRHLQTRRLVAGDSLSLDPEDKSFYCVVDGCVSTVRKVSSLSRACADRSYSPILAFLQPRPGLCAVPARAPCAARSRAQAPDAAPTRRTAAG